MKKLILLTFFLCPLLANAQYGVYDGYPMDSLIIRFTGTPGSGYLADTAATPLWQIGRTHKSFFTTDTSGSLGIVTDTLNPYPANANNWFVIKVGKQINTIVDVWHRYETDSSHAGGVIEFSIDHGMSWQSLLGECNSDSFMFQPGVHTTNCYARNDTLADGTAAFMGSSGSAEIFSRFQFFEALPARTTSGGSGCNWWSTDTFYVRFRFMSDTTSDTLAGWKIDSIKMEYDYYGDGSVARISSGGTLSVYPNPSNDGLFNFPALPGEEQYNIAIYDAMGRRIINEPYKRQINLGKCAPGLYFYKVTDGTEYFSGRLRKE